mgnify:CR=1 FL=1
MRTRANHRPLWWDGRMTETPEQGQQDEEQRIVVVGPDGRPLGTDRRHG